jgi:glycosyltransferase involved in cell wall biosynthesis
VRIVFVSPHVIHGGAERYLALLLAGLDRAWIEGVVFLGDGPFVDDLRRGGYPVTVLPTSARSPGIVRSALRLRRLLRTARPDVVHADGIKGALVAVLATVGGGPPIVWVKHDFSWDGPLVRLVGRRCRTIVAVSSALAEGLPPPLRARTQIIHNGLPELTAEPEAGRRRLDTVLGPRRPERIVLLVGRLNPVKGHRELIAVADGLRARVPGVRIAFIGPGDPHHPDEELELRREASERGLDDVVAFLGVQDGLYDLIAACDVLVMPTVVLGRMGREGFGFTGLEALALGTPVVAYAHGGLPELVGDCGLLVPPGDRDALQHAIVRVLTDDALRERLGSCGRARVAENFALRRMIEAMKACYRETAAGPA